jgi:hypothetical protein
MSYLALLVFHRVANVHFVFEAKHFLIQLVNFRLPCLLRNFNLKCFFFLKWLLTDVGRHCYAEAEFEKLFRNFDLISAPISESMSCRWRWLNSHLRNSTYLLFHFFSTSLKLWVHFWPFCQKCINFAIYVCPSVRPSSCNKWKSLNGFLLCCIDMGWQLPATR